MGSLPNSILNENQACQVVNLRNGLFYYIKQICHKKSLKELLSSIQVEDV